MSITLHTSIGGIKVELFCDKCPEACLNFLALCASGYYNSTIFHRVIPGRLIQGGDRTQKGDGGELLIENSGIMPYGDFEESGLIAYADGLNPRSQFFINVSPCPEINNKYCAFGRVIHGFNNCQEISRSPVVRNGFPLYPVTIIKVTIHSNPFAS